MPKNKMTNIKAGVAPRPQNKSYPAGGTQRVQHSATRAAKRGKRGVIVAPPSGNTDHPDRFEVVHKGFDTLTVAVKANLPPDVYEYLEAQKEIAEKERREVLIEWNGVSLHLAGHGGGGYRFVANGGPIGARWAFKKPNVKDPWGIRVTVGSSFLATLGLGAARTHLDDVLERLGIRTVPEDFSVSRVDYCVDILTDADFALDPNTFVMHSSTNRRDFIDERDMQVAGKPGRTTSVTIGSSRGRQVIIYDKRGEVIQRHKPYWWRIWNQTRELHGKEHIGPDTPDIRVWRLEYRAGKDILKDRWNIRTWEDLFTRFGDLSNETGQVIRYTEPAESDTNRARWPSHPIWEIALAEINTDLIEMNEGTDPNPVKAVQREHHIRTLLKNVKGVTITLAALEGIEHEALPEYFHDTAMKLATAIQADPEFASKQLADAKERYVFWEPDDSAADNTSAEPDNCKSA